MRTGIIFLILFTIFFSCNERDMGKGFNNNDIGISDINILDGGGNDIVKCEDYRCKTYKYILTDVYFDQKNGYYYLYDYDKYSKIDKKKRIVKYNNKSEYLNDYDIIWERDLEDSEEPSEDLHIIYINEDENNLYLSSCGVSDVCKSLTLVRYEKSGDGYRKVYYYHLDLNKDEQDKIFSIVVDSYGNIYLAGEFIKEIDFGNGQVVKNSEECTYTGEPYNPWVCYTDVFLVKIDPEGEAIWSRVFGGEGDDSVFQISSYGEDIYIAIGSIVLKYKDGDKIPYGSEEAKILRIGKYGELKWSRSLVENIKGFYGPVVDRDGNIYIGGRFDLQSKYSNADKNKDLIFAKFDNNGEFIWGKHFESDIINSKQIETTLEYLYVGSIYIDSSLSTYITGVYKIYRKYPSGNLYEYIYDFISKYDKEGNRIGYREFERSGTMYRFESIKYVNLDRGLLYLVANFSPKGDKYIDNCALHGSDEEGRYDKYLLGFSFELCE